jgi:DNA repair protein RadA/Sms
MGKCPGCNSWNSFSEEMVSSSKNSKTSSINNLREKNTAKKLEEIKLDDAHRIDTGLNELNRVLGGGLVAGSVVLLSALAVCWLGIGFFFVRNYRKKKKSVEKD